MTSETQDGGARIWDILASLLTSIFRNSLRSRPIGTSSLFKRHRLTSFFAPVITVTRGRHLTVNIYMVHEVLLAHSSSVCLSKDGLKLTEFTLINNIFRWRNKFISLSLKAFTTCWLDSLLHLYLEWLQTTKTKSNKCTVCCPGAVLGGKDSVEVLYQENWISQGQKVMKVFIPALQMINQIIQQRNIANKSVSLWPFVVCIRPTRKQQSTDA